MTMKIVAPNKTSIFFKNMCMKFHKYFGFPYLWFDDIGTSKVFKYYHRLLSIIIILFILSQWASYWTQEKLPEKYEFDRAVFVFSHPIIFAYYVSAEYYEGMIKSLLYKLAVTLKQDHNDAEIERSFIKRSKFYCMGYLCTYSFALISNGCGALMATIKSEGTFTTVVTFWPKISDNSVSANIARVVLYIIWWALMARIIGAYPLVISCFIAINHQYKNLQSYFLSLNDIFEKEDNLILSQEQKQELYETSLITGLKLHSETLWCVKNCATSCRVIFGGQILINGAVLCMLMFQIMNSERTLMNALAILSMSMAVLYGSGCLMWNAGDITVEAALLPSAIFYSGWHHCRGSASTKVRKLVMIAVSQSQKPVIIRSFGIIELSYGMYLSIVKTSYSVFSVFY